MQWRLLLCEERPLVSAGVHGIFDDVSDIEIIAPGGGRYAVPDLADRLRPDAVLLGVTRVDDSVLSVLQDMRTNGLPRVLLMVDHDANAELVKAVHAGARGFVRTDYPAELVVRAVRDVLAGHAVLPPVLVDRLLAMVAKDRPARHVVAPPHVGRLSHREQDVLRLIAEGLVDHEIGLHLDITVATVRSHVHHILGKLGVRDRAQAVAYALRYRLVKAY